ncbi:MAG: hypothetical protein AB1589_45720 [Cyanobacteriota bacterium]
MPTCPNCRSAHLIQQKDSTIFKCKDCKKRFKLVEASFNCNEA